MTKLFVDFFPILLFFIVYKWFGIYTATAIAMVAAFGQLIWHWMWYRSVDMMQGATCVIIVVLGSATLFFHDPLFIKLKPTGIYWIASLLFLGSTVMRTKPLIQRLMDGHIDLPVMIWQRLNMAWGLFFMVMGALNLYIAYNYTTEAWVYFKLFGGVGLILLFVLLQAFYLTKHWTPHQR